MESKHFLSYLGLILLLATSAAALSRREFSLDKNDVALADDDEYSCVWTIYVRTSKTILGGTDSIISAKFYDDYGDGVLIKNLQKWGGIMEEGHKYYERGNLDIFTGRVPCLERPVCAMELSSDGSGFSHSWFCNYVEVTSTGPHMGCSQQLFTVDDWLSRDRGPKELTAVRDNCNSTSVFRRHPAKLITVDIDRARAASASASASASA